MQFITLGCGTIIQFILRQLPLLFCTLFPNFRLLWAQDCSVCKISAFGKYGMNKFLVACKFSGRLQPAETNGYMEMIIPHDIGNYLSPLQNLRIIVYIYLR